MLLKALLLAFPVFAFAPHETPVLGISLRATDLTIVQSLADGSTSLIAQIPANSTYTSSFEKAVKLLEQKSTVDIAALHEALLAAQYAVSQALQQHAQFTIATAPEEIKDLVLDVLTTLNLIAPLETHASNYIRPESAVHYAYRLGNCEVVGLPQGCDPEDIDGEALWLDFDAASLNVRLLSFQEYGADSRARSVFSGIKGDRSETMNESLINALQKHFSDFLDQNTVLKDFLDRRGRNFKPLRSDVVAIIMSGDPSPGSLEAVRVAIHRISPDLENLI